MQGKFCYHGIGENLLRLESIMNNGIVSANKGKKIEGFSVNGSGHYNGSTNISVAIPHDDNSGALRVYILDGGISFYIKDVDFVLASNTRSDSGFADEGYVADSIEKKQIEGIIVNSNIRSKKISELSVIGKPGYGSIIPITESTVNQLKSCGININGNLGNLKKQLIDVIDNSEMDYFDREKKIEEIRNQIDRLLGEAVQELYNKKLKKDNATIMDVIHHYNPYELPILDENDVKNQCKGIKLQQQPYVTRERSMKTFRNRMERPNLENIDDLEGLFKMFDDLIRSMSKDGREVND